MKCMMIAALAIVATVQAEPHGGFGIGGEFRGVGGGRGGGGIGGGIGLGGRGGSESGGGYGHSDYTGGSSSYGDSGYGAGAHSAGHQVGHKVEDFDQETHKHQASGVDIGGATQVGQGGHSAHGRNNYEAGDAGYGHRFNNRNYVAL